MQKRLGTYHLGRVVKGYYMDQDKLLEAIRRAVTISVGKFKWTIGEVLEGEVDGHPYISGTLMKYRADGVVPVVDEVKKVENTMLAPGLLEAKSPFVYFRDFSGIAYLHVWNQIEERTFRQRFGRLICEKYQNFFVECEIAPISDIASFSQKVSCIDRLVEIRARVKPPNPLFGECWKNLNESIRKRNTTALSVHEEGQNEANGISSRIKEILDNILSKVSLDTVEPLFLPDAAILMAADGYGSGFVKGMTAKNKPVVIHTAETQRSVSFAKDPDVDLFAKRMLEEFIAISEERQMKHAKP